MRDKPDIQLAQKNRNLSRNNICHRIIVNNINSRNDGNYQVIWIGQYILVVLAKLSLFSAANQQRINKIQDQIKVSLVEQQITLQSFQSRSNDASGITHVEEEGDENMKERETIHISKISRTPCIYIHICIADDKQHVHNPKQHFTAYPQFTVPSQVPTPYTY